jgi:RNA polymerase sigma factor (sigma-70 family)
LEYTIEDRLIGEEDKQILTKQIEKIMSCLTPHQKEIIYFRFFHEMSYSEIAGVMNISRQVVKNILYRTFEKIRKKYPHFS